MSIKLMSAVWDLPDPDLANSRLLILLAMADHANDNGVCWPSIPTLAQRARISERQTQRVIQWLIHHGYVEITIKGNGKGHSNMYQLHILGDILSPNAPPKDDKLSPNPKPKGDIFGANGDIFGVNGDTIVSSEPSLDPSRDPSNNNNDVGAPTAKNVVVVVKASPPREREPETNNDVVVIEAAPPRAREPVSAVSSQQSAVTSPPREHEPETNNDVVVVVKGSLPPRAREPVEPEPNPVYVQTCRKFEINGFGFLTPLLCAQIARIVDTYPESWIGMAMDTAVRANRRRLDYVEGCLRNWQREGFDPARGGTEYNRPPPQGSPKVISIPKAAQGEWPL